MEANVERRCRSDKTGSQCRGSEILLDVLRSQGTRFIFGNPGTTELPLIDALVTNRDIKYVWGLQEATAVSMADGYAQASGYPAFVNLHTSGGLGHGMGAIMNAKIARVPMVVTAGQQDLRHFLADPLLAADLVGMAAPIAKWCFEPNSLDNLPLFFAPLLHISLAAVNNFPSVNPYWRGSLPITARGISEVLGRYDCMLGLGGKTLV